MESLNITWALVVPSVLADFIEFRSRPLLQGGMINNTEKDDNPSVRWEEQQRTEFLWQGQVCGESELGVLILVSIIVDCCPSDMRDHQHFILPPRDGMKSWANMRSHDKYVKWEVGQ